MVWSRNSSEGFLSTPSARRATSAAASGLCCSNNFYPRPPRGGRLVIHVANSRRYGISIHALREEGDGQSAGCPHRTDGFLSTPSARRATEYDPRYVDVIVFLSTPSARRATALRLHLRTHRADFYPRPPRGGRRGDLGAMCFYLKFLSTPSARRATAAGQDSAAGQQISIHALREEGDLWPFCGPPCRVDFYPRPPRGGRQTLALIAAIFTNFYPRPPRGGRRLTAQVVVVQKAFLSTPSARRATAERLPLDGEELISIHALREEGDVVQPLTHDLLVNFYPRPPRGGRQQSGEPSCLRRWISIHALREEGDHLINAPTCCLDQISIHALREEGDRIYRWCR